jgi:hypothetical protein
VSRIPPRKQLVETKTDRVDAVADAGLAISLISPTLLVATVLYEQYLYKSLPSSSRKITHMKHMNENVKPISQAKRFGLAGFQNGSGC